MNSLFQTAPLRLYYSIYDGDDPVLPLSDFPFRSRDAVASTNSQRSFDSLSLSSIASRSSFDDDGGSSTEAGASSSPTSGTAAPRRLSLTDRKSIAAAAAAVRGSKRYRSKGGDDDGCWQDRSSKVIKREPVETYDYCTNSTNINGSYSRFAVPVAATAKKSAPLSPSFTVDRRRLTSPPSVIVPASLCFTPLVMNRISSVSPAVSIGLSTASEGARVTSSSSSSSSTSNVAAGTTMTTAADGSRPISLTVTIPKNFLKDLVVARQMDASVRQTSQKRQRPQSMQQQLVIKKEKIESDFDVKPSLDELKNNFLR